MMFSSLYGCSSMDAGTSVRSSEPDEAKAILAVPLQVSYQNELALAKIGQLLSSSDLNPDQRAELYYERGVVFDRVGLRTMARIDFNRALRERPDFAEAYNFIGVYLTQQQDFDNAYDAFDSALELAPDYDYAFLNRGIALYYGQRPKLAVEDLSEFYRRRPEDPYRVLCCTWPSTRSMLSRPTRRCNAVTNSMPGMSGAGPSFRSLPGSSPRPNSCVS